MNSVLRLCLTLFFTIPALAASSDRAVLAAMALAEQPSYSWVADVQDDARSYTIEGRISRDGFMRVTLPMIQPVAERLGRDGGTTIEAIFNGPERFVLNVDGSWKTFSELPPVRPPESRPVTYSPPPPMPFLDPLYPEDPLEAFEAPDPFSSYLTMPVSTFQKEKEVPFSNARLAASPPHEELAIIVSSCPQMTVVGDTVTGEIDDSGARLLLCPGDESFATPVVAAGRFKLWLKGDVVVRYQLQLEGVLLVDRKKRKVVVHQFSDTRVKNIGTTELEVPQLARLKLAN